MSPTIRSIDSDGTNDNASPCREQEKAVTGKVHLQYYQLGIRNSGIVRRPVKSPENPCLQHPRRSPNSPIYSRLGISRSLSLHTYGLISDLSL